MPTKKGEEKNHAIARQRRELEWSLRSGKHRLGVLGTKFQSIQGFVRVHALTSGAPAAGRPPLGLAGDMVSKKTWRMLKI